MLGEGDHRQDLGEDLEHVNVRPPGVELSHEPGWHRSGVVPSCVAHSDDVAPPVGTSVRVCHRGVGWHPSCLMSKLALQEESVDHTVDRPWGGEWDQARGHLLQQCRGPGVRSDCSPDWALDLAHMGATAARPTLPKTVWLTKFSFPARRWAVSGVRRFSWMAAWIMPRIFWRRFTVGARVAPSRPRSTWTPCTTCDHPGSCALDSLVLGA